MLTEYKASGRDILLETDSFFIYVDSSAFLSSGEGAKQPSLGDGLTRKVSP